MIDQIVLPSVADTWHTHLRGNLTKKDYRLPFMVEHLVKSGFRGRVLAEPNLEDQPVVDAETYLAYKEIVEQAIIDVVGKLEAGFEVVYTVQITPNTTPDMIYKVNDLGVRVGKAYPRNVTTNSKNGLEEEDYVNQYPVFGAMNERHMILQHHGEHPSKDVQGPAKPAKFIHRILEPMVRKFPRFKMSLEHVSTAFQIQWIRGQNPNPSIPPTIVGGLTPQHIFCTQDDVNGYTPESNYKGHPELICKPMIGWNDDRAAIQAAATSGEPFFIFAPDDAAHYDCNKGPGDCSCGTLNTTESLPVLAEVFVERGVPHMMPVFLDAGRLWYGFPPNEKGALILKKDPWVVPHKYWVKGTSHSITPMLPGRTLNYKLAF